MRIVVALFLGFLVAPGAASAGLIQFRADGDADLFVDMFGASHVGNFSGTEINREGSLPIETGFFAGEFSALSGPLLSLTVETDSSGNPFKSIYRYDGGTFDMVISGDTGGGTFTASILGEFVVTFDEVGGSDVTAAYQLGPGLLDPALAKFLHVGRETLGGSVNDSFLFAYAGDLSTPSRAASEGLPSVSIEVSEPASWSMLALGLAKFLGRARRRDASGRHP